MAALGSRDGGPRPTGDAVGGAASDTALVRDVIDGAPMVMFVVGHDGTIRWVNTAVEGLFGYAPAEVLDRNMLDFVDIEWNPIALDSIGAAFTSSGLQRPMLFRIVRKDGRKVVVEVTANSQLTNPVVDGLMVYLQRHDERHLLDLALESLASGEPIEATYELLVRVMGAETLEAGGALLHQPEQGRFRRTIAAPGLPAELSDDDGGAATPWARALAAGELVSLGVDELDDTLAAVARSSGFVRCWAAPVAGPDGADACLVMWRSDDEEPDHTCRFRVANLVRLTALVIERTRSAAEMAHAASHDALTGLANRARFFAVLQDALDAGGDADLDGASPSSIDLTATAATADADGNGDAAGEVGVLYVDLDGFKPVNDTYGHGAGDSVLREVARRMADVVGAEGLVARLGGDEFTVLCPQVRHPSELGLLAKRLNDAVLEPISIGTFEVQVGASIGIATSPRGACSIDVLIDAADAALYEAKTGNKGGYHFATP